MNEELGDYISRPSGAAAAKFTEPLNAVRDQGVGGSNPQILSPRPIFSISYKPLLSEKSRRR
jgi:hypothetical protein